MGSTTICSKCRSDSVIFDPDNSTTVCTNCGIQYSIGIFQSSADPLDSSFVPHSASDFSHKERKHYHAKSLILDLATRLNLSSSRSNDVITLISNLTSNSFGDGLWFPVLAAAASYVVARRHRIPLSLLESAAAVGCDEHQIRQMVSRIISFLPDSEPLPVFDSVASLERAIRTGPSFSEIDKERKEELVKVGRFLIQCMIKWFLMTGRRPMPAVAAVAKFVAEVNGLEVDMAEIAKELYAKIGTCRIRLKELKETLIKVARALLPWGKDVNSKNLVQNMPVLIRVMEAKARLKKKKKTDEEEGFEFNLAEYLTVYSNEEEDEEDSEYFRVDRCEGVASCGEVKVVKISAESILSAYKDPLEKLVGVRKEGGGCFGNGEGREKRRRMRMRDMESDGGWEGCSEWTWDLDRKLTLEQVLERDVGYDALPPSFVRGVESRKRRRLKIDAAKNRINHKFSPALLLTSSASLVVAEEEEDERVSKGGRKRRRKRGGGRTNGGGGGGGGGLDWEDCIIELLLLHHVDEGEIEQGQYNRLLDLHVFSLAS